VTDKKILTPAEALLALGEGRKLTNNSLGSSRFIHLSGGRIRHNNGQIFLDTFEDFYEYKEPKPKRKLAPYIITTGVYTFMTDKFFESDEHVKTTWQHFTIIRRVTELEVEIE
jgi:hypothetical protein